MHSLLGMPIRVSDATVGDFYLTEKTGGLDFDEDLVPPGAGLRQVPAGQHVTRIAITMEDPCTHANPSLSPAGPVGEGNDILLTDACDLLRQVFDGPVVGRYR